MPSISTSLAYLLKDGTGVQRSEQVAVAPSSTPIEKPSSEVVIKILCSMLQRMLFETPSRDAVSLALGAAEHELTTEHGITQEEWDYVEKIVLVQYEKQRRRNPLSGMF